MTGFARGKHAKAISDRSGMEFPYREMVKEWNGSLVHISEYESKHPQLEPRAYAGDPQGLKDSRVDRTEPEGLILLEPDSFQTMASGSGIINVSEKGHGRSTGDTVRLEDLYLQHQIQMVLKILKVLMVLVDQTLQRQQVIPLR